MKNQINARIVTSSLKISLSLVSLLGMFYTYSASAEGLLPLVPSGHARADRLQTVPNSITYGSPLVQGDKWTFSGYPKEDVVIKVDTRDDFGNETSGLDPVVILLDPQGNEVAWEDDNAECSVDPVCGFSCPRLHYELTSSGRYTIIVRDYNHAVYDEGYEQCNGGSYHLSLESISILKTAPSTLSAQPVLDDGIVEHMDMPNDTALISEMEAVKHSQTE